MPAEALADYVLKAGDDEADGIRSYVEWQAPNEAVRHLEKVASEVFSAKKWLHGMFGPIKVGGGSSPIQPIFTHRSFFRVWTIPCHSMSASRRA